MPKPFESCAKKRGSKIRTIKPKGKSSRKFMKVCIPKKGSSVGGHMQTRKGKK